MTQTQTTSSPATAGAITLNGRLFAASQADVAASQSSGGPSYSGHYSKTRNGGLTLHDASGLRVGGINKNRVLHSSTRMDDGRWWHSYGTPAVVGKYASFRQERDDVAAALRMVNGER